VAYWRISECSTGCVKGLEALRLALVEEAIFSGHFSHVTRPPTLAGVALMSTVLALRRDGHVVVQWAEFVVAAAAHDRQLLASESVVEAETKLMHTVVRLLSRLLKTVVQLSSHTVLYNSPWVDSEPVASARQQH